jgi:hypothetical protein
VRFVQIPAGVLAKKPPFIFKSFISAGASSISLLSYFFLYFLTRLFAGHLAAVFQQVPDQFVHHVD